MSLSDQDLERLLEATRVVSSTLRLSELLEKVMGLAGQVVRAEASALLLLDEATGELYFNVALGEKGGALQQVRLKKGEGIAGWVAENNKPAVVNDVAKDPRWTQRADKTSQFTTRAILAVPMMIREKMIGVMEAINRTDGAPFDANDLRILEAFALQAAVAIENARLFESIRQEKEKMSTVIGEMSEGVVLTDAAGMILVANPAAKNLLGNPAIERSPWLALEPIFEIRPTWDEITRTLGGAGGMEFKRKKEPRLLLSGVINQVCSDTGKVTGYLMVFRDVTEERRESQLKKSFLALVSHKLRTPLVAIRGFTPLLLEKPEELEPFQRQALEAIDRSSQLLTALVEKLTQFSLLEADTIDLTLKPYPLTDVLDMALVDLAVYLKTQEAEVVRDASIDHLPLLPLDKNWMKEVLRNIVENAVKFNPKAPRKVIIKASQPDKKFIELSMSDNGPGIPPEEQRKIFQKFYQIEGNFTGQVVGMGLGLSLVKRVVEAHGGEVILQSVFGQGSTFILRLPLSS